LLGPLRDRLSCLEAMSVLAPKPRVSEASIPEQGQLVRLRNRLFLLQDVVPHQTDAGPVITRVDLECLDDDRLGEPLSVLWEQEVGPRIEQADVFPVPSGKWTHPDTYDAYLTGSSFR